MAQKKRLGKDPFAGTAPTPEPQTVTPPAPEANTQTAPVKKHRTAVKKPAEPKAVIPVSAVAPPENPVPEIKLVQSQRDAEIDAIKREVAELQAIVLKLQQQLEIMQQWNETFFSPWQWWFSLFS